MAQPTLRVDYAALDFFSSNLHQVSDSFDALRDSASSVASAIPHPGLSRAINDFANNWRRPREELVTAMRSVGTTAGNLVERFREMDNQNANAIPGGGN